MLDIDTFLTTLYVMVDDVCKDCLAEEHRPGPPAALTRSEVLTVAIVSQWQPWGSERGLYRYAQRHLRGAFPTLPARSHCNRLLRQHQAALVECFLWWVQHLQAPRCAFEARDATAAPTRDAKRRGQGWLPGLADIGWRNRLGGYAGFHGLLAAHPVGVITGFGYAPASTQDQPLAETCLAVPHRSDARLRSVGAPAQGPYVAEQGFAGPAWHVHWRHAYGAEISCPPRRNSTRPWSRAWRRWLAGIRPIVETVTANLAHVFRLERERPHELSGFQARRAAKMTLHNVCIWFNEQLGRPRLAFVDLRHW